MSMQSVNNSQLMCPAYTFSECMLHDVSHRQNTEQNICWIDDSIPGNRLIVINGRIEIIPYSIPEVLGQRIIRPIFDTTVDVISQLSSFAKKISHATHRILQPIGSMMRRVKEAVKKPFVEIKTLFELCSLISRETMVDTEVEMTTNRLAGLRTDFLNETSERVQLENSLQYLRQKKEILHQAVTKKAEELHLFQNNTSQSPDSRENQQKRIRSLRML